MMSSSEDEEELYKMVTQTLELNGTLPKIRAQLTSNLFLRVAKDAQFIKLLTNNTLRSYLDRPKSQLMFSLVREFLEFFSLDSTIPVLEIESNLGLGYKYEGRQKLCETLGVSDSEFRAPLLLHLLEAAQKKSPKINLANGTREDSILKSSIDSKDKSSDTNSKTNNSLDLDFDISIDYEEDFKSRIKEDLSNGQTEKTHSRSSLESTRNSSSD